MLGTVGVCVRDSWCVLGSVGVSGTVGVCVC